MIERFAFRRPPFLPPLAILALLGAPAGFLVPWYADVRAGASPWPGLVFAAVFFGAVTAVVCLARYATRPKEGPAVELDDDRVWLPLSSASRRRRPTAYADILSCSVLGTGRRARLVLATHRRRFVYPLTHFGQGAATAAELRTRLRARIAALPAGAEQLHAMNERDDLATEAMRRTPYVSVAILLLVAGTYLWTLLSGALEGPFGLVDYGANAPVLVARGEWHRLFSASFLHANLLHAYLNGVGILALGMPLERLVGAWRMLCIYLASALAGSCASMWASLAAYSVGASTAIFGLLGALAVVNWRFHAQLPGSFRQPLRWWVFILGINALLPLLVPVIDYAAHAGGFASGAILAGLLCRDVGCLRSPHAVGAPLKAATLGLTAVFGVALTQAVVAALQATASARTLVARSFVSSDSAGAEALNNMAWHYATHHQASAEELGLAEEAAASAVRKDPDQSAYLDTLATVYYRRGDLDRAITTEQRAVAASEQAVFVSQMGRFLDARLSMSQAADAASGDPPAIRLSVERDGGEGAIVVSTVRDFERGVEVYALDRVDGRLVGTLRVVIEPGARAGAHRFVPDGGSSGTRWPRAATLLVGYAEASDAECDVGTVCGRYFVMAPEVRNLP